MMGPKTVIKTLSAPVGDVPRQRIQLFKELGVVGAKVSGGFVHDDFLNQLNGAAGRRTYRQMRDNDAIIGSILFAVEMLFRAVTWSISTDAEGALAEERVDFLDSVLFKDMSHPWDDVIAQAASMLTFGWQYSEVTYKRRIGPTEKDPARRSLYTDGRIGIRKISDRSQETLWRWEIDEGSGEIFGLWQQSSVGDTTRFIPIDKALLFRPHLHNGSPEGRSVLRTAYRSWYMETRMQEIEAIAAERELNGLPVVKIPGQLLGSDEPAAIAQVAEYQKMARDVKFNSQGGLVLPSDTYRDADGRPTNVAQVSFELVATKGSRAIDIDKTIRRYQTDIARTILADFIMLGQAGHGSFALSRSKVDLFTKAAEGWLESIAQTINRHLIPPLWKLNGFPLEDIPYIVPGKIAPEDIQELGNFVEALSRAGVPIMDEATENHLRRAGGLPEAPIDGEDGRERSSTIPAEASSTELDATNAVVENEELSD